MLPLVPTLTSDKTLLLVSRRQIEITYADWYERNRGDFKTEQHAMNKWNAIVFQNDDEYELNETNLFIEDVEDELAEITEEAEVEDECEECGALGNIIIHPSGFGALCEKCSMDGDEPICPRNYACDWCVAKQKEIDDAKWCNDELALELNHNNSHLEGRHPDTNDADWKLFLECIDGEYTEELYKRVEARLKERKRECESCGASDSITTYSSGVGPTWDKCDDCGALSNLVIPNEITFEMVMEEYDDIKPSNCEDYYNWRTLLNYINKNKPRVKWAYQSDGVQGALKMLFEAEGGELVAGFFGEAYDNIKAKEKKTDPIEEEVYKVVSGINELCENHEHLKIFRTYSTEGLEGDWEGDWKTTYFQTYGGGPEGGYFLRVFQPLNGFDPLEEVYRVERKWGAAFTVEKVNGGLDYNENGDGTMGTVRFLPS